VRPWVIVEAVRRMHGLIARGFDVRGYHHWTLVDNFEWDSGWDLRFGLYELNLATQDRNVRRSGRFFGEVARRNGLDRQTIVQYDAPELWP
jgi:beta-glucosidase/6-phospho-beta-glucosidase/beta-galactosidase